MNPTFTSGPPAPAQPDVLTDETCRSVLSRLADLLLWLDFADGSCRLLSRTMGILDGFPEAGAYSELFEQYLAACVLPMEELPVRATLSLQSLRRAWAAGDAGASCRFTLNSAGLTPVLCRALFSRGGERDGAMLVFLSERTSGPSLEPGHHTFNRYDAALRSIYDVLYELNITRNSYRIVYHVENKSITPPEAGRLDQMVRQVADHLVFPEDRSRFLDLFDLVRLREAFASGRDSVMDEFRELWQDGRFHWSSLTVLPARNWPGEDLVYLCCIMDIDEKKRADLLSEQNAALLRHQMDNERYRVIVEQTGTMVFEWSKEQNMRYLSPKLTDLFAGEYDSRDLTRVWREDRVVHEDDLALFDESMEAMRNGSRFVEMTLRMRTRNRGFLWCRIALTKIVNESDQILRVIGTIQDVDESVHSERALKYRAEYDTLTGIYNMDTFCTYARVRMLEQKQHKFALIRVDIHRFKLINDVYGIEEGDKLLKYIATTLQSDASKANLVGRIGGDVFCMCVTFETERELEERAERLSDRISSYQLGSRVIPTIGICVVDDPSVPVSILCDWANLALRTVKGNMIKNWAFYDDTLRARQLSERTIESEMYNALAQRQFCVYLQPKHDIGSGRIIGGEALVRWNHPREGLMPPNRFIPLFERNGFVVQLDEFVWEETCRLQRRWLDEGRKPVPVSVNVSRTHIYDPAFGDKLQALVAKYDLPHSLIELELTESTFIENPNELFGMMEHLRSKGFVFSMDDFGSGYSSLNMLKSAAVNVLKLDREFLNETAATKKGQTVIQYTIAMARQLGLDVLAEGVETKDQASFLLEAGCTSAQGYYFSKPMPPEEFERIAFA